MGVPSSSIASYSSGREKTLLTVVIVLAAFVMLVVDMSSYGSFSFGLESIANRTGSDEKLYFDIGSCIHENGIWSYFERCSKSTKPLLIGIFVASALFVGGVQSSAVYAILKFVFCWALILVAVRRLCKRCPEFDQNLILIAFLFNRFWAHLHVQLLRDDLIAAVGVATVVELFLFILSRRQIWKFNFCGSLFLLLRPEMFAIYLTMGNLFAFVLKSNKRTWKLKMLSLSLLMLFVLSFQFYIPATSLIYFDSVQFLSGVRKAFFSPIPSNAFLGIGDMRFVPIYSVLVFFVSLCAAFIFGLSILRMLIYKTSKIQLSKFYCFVLIPMTTVAGYSLINLNVQGPRQSLACSMTIFAFWIIPMVFPKKVDRKT